MSITLYSRRKVLARAAAISGSSILFSRYAKSAEFMFKLGSEMAAGHPSTVRAIEAVRRIREETEGRVEIQVFPNNQLGSGSDMLNQLRSGALEFFMQSTQLLAPLVPHCALPGVGFGFKSNDGAMNAMDGELGAYLRGLIDKAGLVVMPKVWANGFRHVTSNIGPIKTPDEMHGLKIRVAPSPLLISLFKGFGSSPTAINFAELYTSLQTKIVDAQECALVTIDASRMYEVQQFCAFTKHSWDAFSLLGNRRAWARLPSKLQAVVSEHFDRSALAQRSDMDKLEARLRDELSVKGMKFNDVNIQAFHDKLRAAGYYTAWKEKFGPDAWRLLEKFSGPLA